MAILKEVRNEKGSVPFFRSLIESATSQAMDLRVQPLEVFRQQPKEVTGRKAEKLATTAGRAVCTTRKWISEAPHG